MSVEKPNNFPPTGETAKPIDENLKEDLVAMDQAKDRAIAEMEEELKMRVGVPEKYKELVSGIEEKSMTSWGETFISSSSGTGMKNLFVGEQSTPFARVFIEAARGKNVCDLGGGQYPGAGMLFPTESAYAKRYINIDLNTRRSFLREETTVHGSPTVELFLHDDILSFVSRVGDESMDTYIMSGLEPVGPKGNEYAAAIIAEVYRSLKKGGHLVYGYNPDFPEEYTIKLLIEQRKLEEVFVDVTSERIYKKIL